MSRIKHPEKQYLELVDHILKHGYKEKGRNGNVLTHIGAAMRFQLYDEDRNNKPIMPLMTTKKMAWKTCLKELLWFMRGETDNTILQQQDVRIWDNNASREFLDFNGLTDNNVNDLGPIYGHQWRHFNAPYVDCDIDYTGYGEDQLQNIVNCLKDKKRRNSRRLIMSAWNPCQLNQMVLPPCHVLSQFHVVDNDKLICTLYQRSADVGLGLPFNIASYSFLTHILAHHCGLKASELIHFIGNAHIYEDHIEPLKEQLDEFPELYPTLEIKDKKENIYDYEVSDFDINDYIYSKKINMKMRA
jgi:thymidylate synthase